MNMNILFVSPSYNPLDGTGWGSVQRTNLLFEACTQLGHVDVITFVDNVISLREDCSVLYAKSDNEMQHKERRVQKLLRMFAPWNPYTMFPKNAHRAAIVRQFVQKKYYDLIVCRYIPSAMECGLFDFADKLVIDIDDNPLDVEKTAARTSRTLRNRLYHRFRAIVIGHVLRKIQNQCHFTFYANPTQAIYKNSAYLPNIPFYDYDMRVVEFSKTTNRILFVGNMSYGPNSAGVLHFIKYILPLIQKEIPNVELHLVGGCNDESFLTQCKSVKGVQYMGFVDSLEDEYSQARVVAVPIYGGAGTNIKVLEAMKMSRPCVTTIYGVRGFLDYFHHGQEIFVAADDTLFASAIIDMLRDKTKNHSMSQRAQAVVTAHFSHKAFNEIVKNNLSL